MARILVVDDVAGLRTATAAALRWAGHSARTAPGGEEALEMIDADVPDVARALPRAGPRFRERVRLGDGAGRLRRDGSLGAAVKPPRSRGVP